MRDRLPLLGLSFALLLGVTGLLFARASARGEFAEPLSTYSSQGEGARALFLLAEQVGMRPERRQLDLEHIEGTPELVLLGVEGDEPDGDDPSSADAGFDPWSRERLTEAESTELIRAVESGATLLYAVGRDHPFLTRLGVDFTPLGDTTPRELVPLSPTPFSQGVKAVQVPIAGYVEAAGALPLVVDAHGAEPVAILLHRGAGRVVVLAAPRLASNRHLLDDNNAAFLINTLLALKPAHGTIGFDEYHHGFTNDRSVMDYAGRFGLPWMVLQAIFALGVWSAARRRIGPPAALVDDRPPASADYLLAMSRIYQRGGHRRHVAQLLVRGVLRPLRGITRLPVSASVDAVVSALQSRGRGDLATELADLERRLASDLDESQLLGLAQAVSQLRAHLHVPLRPDHPA